MKVRTARRGRAPGRGDRRAALESRKTRALVLLANGRLSVSGLARKLGVSEVTVKRLVRDLRRSGEEISSFRVGREAYYELRDTRPWNQVKKDPLLTMVIPASRMRPARGKPEDADYDSD